MLRGEIRLVDLDPARRGEGDKTRPAVIVSIDGANTTAARLGHGVVTVVPVTSNVDRVFPSRCCSPQPTPASIGTPRPRQNRSAPCPSNASPTRSVPYRLRSCSWSTMRYVSTWRSDHGAPVRPQLKGDVP